MITKIKIDMIKYNAHDSKRISHALKVYSYAKIIGESENLSHEDMTALEIASVLHDIGIKECVKKYNSTNGFLQQVEGPPIAESILLSYDIEDVTLKRVLFLIAHHHTFKNVSGLDYQILLEADLIVNAQEEYITEYAFKNAVNKLFVTQTGKRIAEDAL